ncbi:MAG TPA: hypothetical protein VLV49_05150 [Terriglobales bacterium]|nr:hypothetical protein [Terriglobales bacterium]
MVEAYCGPGRDHPAEMPQAGCRLSAVTLGPFHNAGRAVSIEELDCH